MTKLRVLFETRSRQQAFDFATGVFRYSPGNVEVRENMNREGVKFFEVLGPEGFDSKFLTSFVPQDSSDDEDEGEVDNELGLKSSLCSVCSGSGENRGERCFSCRGDGWVVLD